MTSKPLCKHDWVGDDDCAYCAVERLTASCYEFDAAVAECERQEKEIERLTRERDELASKLDLVTRPPQWKIALESAFEFEREASKAERDRLRAALEKYGDHADDCHLGTIIEYVKCNCGFSEALTGTPLGRGAVPVEDAK